MVDAFVKIMSEEVEDWKEYYKKKSRRPAPSQAPAAAAAGANTPDSD